MSSNSGSAKGASSAASSTGAGRHFGEESRRQQQKQQELYTWLQAEYSRLVQQQEAIKKHKEGSGAHTRLHEEYKRRHSAYQVNLGEYHKCQQAILNAVKRGGFAAQTSSSSAGATAAPAGAGAKSKPAAATRSSSTHVRKVGGTNKRTMQPQHQQYQQQKHHKQNEQMLIEATQETTKDGPSLSVEVNSRMRSVIAMGKRPASDYRGLEVRPEAEILEYQDRYDDLRGRILQRCLELGRERGCGMALWHGYWNGLRAFVLYRISRQEFESLLVEELALPPDILQLHNSLIATVLLNVRAKETPHSNLALIPYVLTEEEVSELRVPCGAAGSKAQASSSEPASSDIDGDDSGAQLFYPMLDAASWQSGRETGNSQRNKPNSALGEAPAPVDSKLGELVGSLHGDVLAVRPALEVSAGAPPDDTSTIILHFEGRRQDRKGKNE